MIKIERTQVTGWAPAIRGMRNPLNSWDRSDTYFFDDSFTGWHNCLEIKNDISAMEQLGDNDYDLMKRLCKGGPVHAKFRRMIVVYVDITAPLYWYKEADTYKVGTVCNSCSTMHKIHSKEFTIDDFSHEHLIEQNDELATPEYYEHWSPIFCPYSTMEILINALNTCREKFIETGDKVWWWQIIQLLPSSYNQKRTMMFNYEVLANIYEYRQNHKLDEWRDFCKWIETLPFSEIITGKWDADKDEDEDEDEVKDA